jgi:ribosomal protein S18 acetylase RimI-like enzyme
MSEALERIADRAWPAQQRGRLGEWLLNASAGFSGRINACWPLGSPGVPVAAALDVVEAWYAARGLPPLFKPVVGLADPAFLKELERRGYASRTETLMMTGTLDGWSGEAVVTGDPDDGFRQVFEAAQGDPADATERMGAFLRIAGPRFFARIDVDGQPAAIGGSAVEGEWAGLFGMRTVPDQRRKGLARQVAGALFAAAQDAGATRGYLQVEANNAAAIALYEGFGFSEAYRYRYWAR